MRPLWSIELQATAPSPVAGLASGEPVHYLSLPRASEAFDGIAATSGSCDKLAAS
jgi:hypothetical protein